MSKFVVLLALYAAAVSTFLLVQTGKGLPGGAQPAATASQDGHPDLRKLMHEARQLMSAEIKGRQKTIDLRLSRFDQLQGKIEEGLAAVQEMTEGAADANYGKLETLEEIVEGFGKATAELGGIRAEFTGLEKRMTELEARPPQVIREIVKGGPAAAPVKKGPVGPKRPSLPEAPKKAPQVMAAEIAKARTDILSDDLEILFPAIEKVREYRIMSLVPRLLEILAKHKDEFGRTASAAALGKMRVADAVLPLAEALVDKSDLVAQQANRSIRQITEFNTELPATAGIRKRRAARGKVKEWWRSHEAEVRQRLGQPKLGGGG